MIWRVLKAGTNEVNHIDVCKPKNSMVTLILPYIGANSICRCIKKNNRESLICSQNWTDFHF